MLIAIDGLDGVGKTSVIERLSAKRNWINIASQIDDMRQHVRSAPDHSKSVHRLLNLAFLQHMSDKANVLHKEGHVVLLDRYTPSHSHYAKEFNKEAIEAGEYPDIDPSQLIVQKPDLTIILIADEQVRMKRITKRDEMEEHEFILSKEDITRKNIQKNLEAEADIVIDTSSMSIEEVALLIERHVASIAPTQQVGATSKRKLE